MRVVEAMDQYETPLAEMIKLTDNIDLHELHE